jgi:putative nucleotidyltransferase with HDIG domain
VNGTEEHETVELGRESGNVVRPSRVRGMGTMSVTNQIERIIAACDKLPPFPEVARRLLELAEDSTTKVTDIVEVIQYDQGLTANCLRLCNSSYYGLREKVSSLDHALVLLGMREVVALALALSCGFSEYQKKHRGYGLHDGELWRHSVTCSKISQLVLKKLGWPEDSYIFTASLLHDVGKLILDPFMEESSPKIGALLADGVSLPAAEKQVLGIDHAEVGGMIAKTWRFPESLVGAIQSHHTCLDGEEPHLYQVVAFSNLIAHVSCYHRVGLALVIRPSVLEKFNLLQSDVEDIVTVALAELRKAEELLRIPMTET